mgnify:CR=1 FL=1
MIDELEIEWSPDDVNGDTTSEDQPAVPNIWTVIPLEIDTKAITEKIFSLKDMWVSRSDDYPFYTLGRCAYLDGKTDAYYKNLEQENEILINTFAHLYTHVGEVLNAAFYEDVFLPKDLRVPGFHIFPSDKKFLKIAGNWHQDYPHITLGLEPVDTFAFTLAIQLPKSGGGMDFIDPFHQQQHLAYNEGDLVIHTGEEIHRIAGMKEYVPNEYRITLQGHIVRRDGLLEAFF